MEYVLRTMTNGSAPSSSSSTRKLYQIWSDDNLRLTDTIFKRPQSMSQSDIKELEQDGLIVLTHDSNIEITKKGRNIINVLVLGNDQSIFSKTSMVFDYNKAFKLTQASTKPNIKRASILDKKEEEVWKQLLGSKLTR